MTEITLRDLYCYYCAEVLTDEMILAKAARTAKWGWNKNDLDKVATFIIGTLSDSFWVAKEGKYFLVYENKTLNQYKGIDELKIGLNNGSKQGLKDHQIALLVNSLRESLSHLIPHQCLRELIQQSVVKYLEDNNLRIDKKEN